MPLINLSDAINSFIEIVLPYEHEHHDISCDELHWDSGTFCKYDGYKWDTKFCL